MDCFFVVPILVNLWPNEMRWTYSSISSSIEKPYCQYYITPRPDPVPARHGRLSSQLYTHARGYNNVPSTRISKHASTSSLVFAILTS
jgi:hypothetical protein